MGSAIKRSASRTSRKGPAAGAVGIYNLVGITNTKKASFKETFFVLMSSPRYERIEFGLERSGNGRM